MKNVAVIGASGRMGKEVIAALKQSNRMTFSAGVSATAENGFVTTSEQLTASSIDVVIDFSLPAAMPDLLKWCVKNKKPLVSGTTGITVEHQKLMEQASTQIPLLWAPNMSVGVAVVSEMLKNFAAIPGFDFGIEELHHLHKKDSPSGTALHLKKTLEQSIGKPVDQVVALRGGGIYGIHKVWAMSPEETITVEHTALNRSVFARGALHAADWLVQQKPGLYRLVDTLER